MSQQSTHSPASVTWLGPEPEIKDPADTMPSEYQPPGTDETPRAEEEVATTLEEALTTL